VLDWFCINSPKIQLKLKLALTLTLTLTDTGDLRLRTIEDPHSVKLLY